MSSTDGTILGRLDHVNATAGAVIDYKSGKGGGESMSDRERRQLRLYAYLAAQNGIDVARGIIVRGSGIAVEEPISTAVAESEAENARRVLSALNVSISRASTFFDLAQPSVDGCKDCPCIPFCEPFWQTATLEWTDAVGVHIEGRIRSVQQALVRGVNVVTLAVDILRGTIRQGAGDVQPFPEIWLIIDGSKAPMVEDTLRFVGARIADDRMPVMIYVDRLGTTVWTVDS